MRAFVADQPDTTVCGTCRDEGRILAMWDRPGGPPGNGYVGCPHCEKGHAYTEAIQKETERCLRAERTGWAPTGAQLALELAQNPLTDDESFLQWVERHANRYIEAARQERERCAMTDETPLRRRHISDREILLEHVTRIYEIAKPVKPGALISPIRRAIAQIALEALQKVGPLEPERPGYRLPEEREPQ
jgi:hypothetical protein